MIRRSLARAAILIVVMLGLTLAPGLALRVAGPAAPDEEPTRGAVVFPTRATSTAEAPEAPAADQPGLFTTTPALRTRAATGPFARGNDGVVDVVGRIPDATGQAALVVLRNNTAGPVGAITVTATLPAGAIAGEVGPVVPPVVPAGGLAFAAVTFPVGAGTITTGTLPFVLVSAQPADEPAPDAFPRALDIYRTVAGVTAVIRPAASDSGTGAPTGQTTPAALPGRVGTPQVTTPTFRPVESVLVCFRQTGATSFAVTGWGVGSGTPVVRPGDPSAALLPIPGPGDCVQAIVATASV
jgi:hypothetical protein